jgi:hypothetical protein
MSNIDELIARYGGAGNVRLDIGCGFVKPPGFLGMDNCVGEASQIRNEANAPDIVIDLNHAQWPLPDASCCEVRSSHFLEHSHLDHVFQESARVLVDGGVFAFTVPYANSAEGMFPGHAIFLTETFFHENLMFQKLFRIESESFKQSPAYEAMSDVAKALFPFDVARKVLFNCCNEMTIVARKR